jgi:hypothetical protein
LIPNIEKCHFELLKFDEEQFIINYNLKSFISIGGPHSIKLQGYPRTRLVDLKSAQSKSYGEKFPYGSQYPGGNL